MKLDDKWCELARSACYDLGLITPAIKNESDAVFPEHRAGLFEHMIHELSHAALLGIEPSPRTSETVSGTLNQMSYVTRVVNEAMTFAVEIRVLQLFDLIADDPTEGDRFHLSDMFDAAQIQGCYDRDVEPWIYDERIDDVVDTVVGWITDPGFPSLHVLTDAS